MVQGGRFAYEIPCEEEGTIVIVLPNYSEIPVFVEPGKSVDLKADASHIKDIEVIGTDTNDRMTKWRKNTSSQSPDGLVKQAEQFIKDNPSSIISRWLLRKYFIVTAKPNLKKARELVKLMSEKADKDASVVRLSVGLENVPLQVGDELPVFTAKDLQGKSVQASQYRLGKTVILVWATWDYEGQSISRRVARKIEEMKSQGKQVPKVLGISIDASAVDAKKTVGSDSTAWSTICDGLMWKSPVVKAIGTTKVPDNFVIENGKVKACHLSNDELLKEIEK
jgi:peroxiredoxin